MCRRPPPTPPPPPLSRAMGRLTYARRDYGRRPMRAPHGSGISARASSLPSPTPPVTPPPRSLIRSMRPAAGLSRRTVSGLEVELSAARLPQTDMDCACLSIGTVQRAQRSQEKGSKA